MTVLLAESAIQQNRNPVEINPQNISVPAVAMRKDGVNLERTDPAKLENLTLSESK